MTQSNLLELARQGDPQAIATLMNRTLQPKGITARTELQGDRLRVLLEADQIPNRQAMTTFVRHGITSLGVTTIRAIEITGWQTRSDRPAWLEEVYLGVPVTAAPEPAAPPPPRPHLRLVQPVPPVPPFRPQVDRAAEPAPPPAPANAPVYEVIEQPAAFAAAQPAAAADVPPAPPTLEVVPTQPPSEDYRAVVPAPAAESELLEDWQAEGDVAAAPPPRSHTPLVWLVLLLLATWIGSIIGYSLWQDLSAPPPTPPTLTPPS